MIAEIEADRGIDEASLAPLPVADVVAHAAVATAPAVEAPLEWPRPTPEPEVTDRPPFAKPADDFATARNLVSEPVADDVLELVPAGVAAAPVDEEHLKALQEQIAGLEARLVEQDAALRRVLDLLIEWVERDPDNAPNPAKSQTWAA